MIKTSSPSFRYLFILILGISISFSYQNSIVVADDIGHLQGVMAGEVTENSVILQSRLTETKRTTDGDIPGATGIAQFELSRQPDFKKVSKTNWLHAVPQNDFIVKAKISGLQPGTRYYYRLRYGSDCENLKSGPICEFRTLYGQHISKPVSLVVVTGMNFAFFQKGSRGNGRGAYRGEDKVLGFPALASILKLKPDYFVGTGDNVYYDHPVKTRAKTKTAMRRKWHEQFSQPRFRKLFRSLPTYWEKDDHDFRYNDSDNRPGKLPSAELGKTIFLEQLPVVDLINPSAKTYRTFRINRDLQIWLTEGRDYRSPNNMPDGPEKSLWGQDQIVWLERTLLESDATFKILISPTPLIGPDGKGKRDSHINIGGFRHERTLFFDWLKKNRFLKKNFYFVCGDRHWQYHALDPSGFEEFSCGALVDANSRLGVKPGSKNSTDPDGLIHQIYTQKKKSGGFLKIEVTPPRDNLKSQLHFAFYDEKGSLLYGHTKQANHLSLRNRQ